MRCRLLVGALFGATLALIALPRVARADDATTAKQLFVRARELRQRGDCASALPLFRRAYELDPRGLGSLRNAAGCEESLGHFASAQRAWLDLRSALLNQSASKYTGWAQDSDEAARRLAPKVAWLTVNVVLPPGDTTPKDGIDVTINGQKLAPALVGRPLERDPGTYVVHVEDAQGRSPDVTVQLAAGGVRDLSFPIALARPVVQVPAPPVADRSVEALDLPVSHQALDLPVSPPPAPLDRSRVARRTAAWIALGAGAVGIIGMVASLVVRGSALGDLGRVCPQYATNPCDPSSRAAVQSAV
ncbi:MAG: hypothetical protein ACREJ3_20205, partial [Polyangiaceae bacterium]